MQQAPIFIDNRDRGSLIEFVAGALRICEARLFAFCLMGNHYHLVLQTTHANLSEVMRRINSFYSMAFNRRHMRRGHVFEGRFKALHVDRNEYLLQVCRYVDLNPVRAGLIDSPSQWAWSSYRALAGHEVAPPWLPSLRCMQH